MGKLHRLSGDLVMIRCTYRKGNASPCILCWRSYVTILPQHQYPCVIRDIYLPLSFHGLCGLAVRLTGELLWVHIWDLSASWLLIVQQNRPQATQPMPWIWLAVWGQTSCICGYVMLTLIYHKCAVPQCFYPWTWWKHTDFVMHFSEHILCLNPGRNDDPSVLVNSRKFLFSPLRQRHMIKPISPFTVMGHRLIVLEQTYSLPPQNLYSFKVSFLKCMIQMEPQGSSYRDENEVYW